MALGVSYNKALKLNPGTLRHRIHFQGTAEVSDGAGGFEETWATEVSAWASIEPMNGYEKFTAGKTEAFATHKITMRYQNGISADQRILFGDRSFNIEEIINVDERNAVLRLKVTEGGIV